MILTRTARGSHHVGAARVRMWHNAHAPRGLSQPRAPGTTARDRPPRLPAPAGARGHETTTQCAAIANCTQRPFRHTTSNRRCGWIVVNALFDEHQKMKRLPAYGVPPHARRIRKIRLHLSQRRPIVPGVDPGRSRSKRLVTSTPKKRPAFAGKARTTWAREAGGVYPRQCQCRSGDGG